MEHDDDLDALAAALDGSRAESAAVDARLDRWLAMLAERHGSDRLLIAGPTGSGKTTTVAALVDEINRRDAKHIITIEDPIEYEHQNQRRVVQQIEIGLDAPDFPTALRSALPRRPTSS